MVQSEWGLKLQYEKFQKFCCINIFYIYLVLSTKTKTFNWSNVLLGIKRQLYSTFLLMQIVGYRNKEQPSENINFKLLERKHGIINKIFIVKILLKACSELLVFVKKSYPREWTTPPCWKLWFRLELFSTPLHQ